MTTWYTRAHKLCQWVGSLGLCMPVMGYEKHGLRGVQLYVAIFKYPNVTMLDISFHLLPE